MGTISTKPPSGMRDFLAADVVRRRHVTDVVQRVYESFGFVPLETPAIENLSTLLGKYGPEGDQLLYRLLHRREKLARALEGEAPSEMELSDEGLRYDLTVPLARVVANYRDLPQFYKRYQIQPVWRADRPAKGRFREFYQCDVDITGTSSLVADAEVCGAVATVLIELGFKDFTIHVNHRDLLRAVIAEAGIAAELETTALIAVDKLDKIGADGVVRELEQRGIDGGRGARLIALLESAENATDAAVHGELYGRAKGVLDELFSLLAAGPAAPPIARFDPKLARGLSYYTGPIFEITVKDLAGSLGGGGRYDELIGMFLKKKLPAVGFSLGLERILLVMEERGMFPALAAGPQVVLCRLGDVTAAEAIGCAGALRAQGLRVEVYPDAAQLGKQLQYASTVGSRFAAILGASELAAGTVALKDLLKGEQRSVPLTAVASAVAETAS